MPTPRRFRPPSILTAASFVLVALAPPVAAQTLPEEFRGVPRTEFPDSLVPQDLRTQWHGTWQTEQENRRNLDWFGAVENWDDARAYLSAILDTLLSDQPELRGRVRADIYSLPWVNAEERLDGTLLVDLGLLGRLQDESQLAMVLAHEIAHAKLHHGLDRWIASRRKRSDRQWDPTDRKWMETAVDTHSVRLAVARTQETEADSLGFLLFSRTRYGSGSLDSLFAILGHPLSVSSRRWDRSALPDLPDSVWKGLDQPDPQIPPEESDTGFDHPAPSKRRRALARWEARRSTDGPAFLVDSSFFFHLRERARAALPDRLLESNQPAQAMFEAWGRLSDSNSTEDRRIFSRALADLALACSGSRRWAPSVRTLPTGGEFWTLDRFLRRVDGMDLAVVAVSESRKLAEAGVAQAVDSSLQRELWISMEKGWPRLCQAIRDSSTPLSRVERHNLARIVRLRRLLGPLPPGPWIADSIPTPKAIAGRRVLLLPPSWGELPRTEKFKSRALAEDSLVRVLVSELQKAKVEIVAPDPVRWTSDSLPTVLDLSQAQKWVQSRFDPRGPERWRPRLPLLAAALRNWRVDAVLVVSLDRRRGSPDPDKWWVVTDQDDQNVGLRATWFDAASGAEGRAASIGLPENPSPSALHDAVRELSASLEKSTARAPSCATRP